MPKKEFHLKVEYRSPQELTPYFNNTKAHPTEQIDKIAGAIAEFSFDQPIVIDDQGVIIKGHGRREAAMRLGLDKVPVIVRSDLSDVQKKAARISDNKVAESDWLDDKLKLEVESLMELDFDLNLLGFDQAELDALLGDSSGDGAGAGGADEDDIPDVDEVEPRVKLGEIWSLGRHRLMCGDSTDEGQVRRLMAGAMADIVITDPPYNVDYNPEIRHAKYSSDRTANPLGKIIGDKLPDQAFQDFLLKAFSNINIFLQPGCPIYIFHSDKQAHNFVNAYLQTNWKLASSLVWKKTRLVLGRSDYHSMHEQILYGWKEGAAHRYYGDRKQTTILEFATPHHDKANCDTDGYVHSCQKPTKLLEQLLNNSSQKDDIALDLFGGSGSTLIACQVLQRKAFLMELDPRFATVIIDRWENFTGQEAVLLSEDEQ